MMSYGPAVRGESGSFRSHEAHSTGLGECTTLTSSSDHRCKYSEMRKNKSKLSLAASVRATVATTRWSKTGSEAELKL